MSQAAHRRATWEDIASLPEGDRTEVVDGELFSAPSPLPRHGFIEGAVAGFVGIPFQYDPKGPGGWWIVPEVDVELTPHDVVRIAPFDAVEIDAGRLFPPEEPTEG